MTQRISATPDPVGQGQELTICYGFDDLPDSSVQLDLDWDPAGPPSSITVTADEPCQTVSVPINAEDLVIRDTSGHSQPKSVLIQ